MNPSEGSARQKAVGVFLGETSRTKTLIKKMSIKAFSVGEIDRCFRKEIPITAMLPKARRF